MNQNANSNGNLNLTLLGRAEIRLDGQTVPQLKSKKAQALLFYLAVTGHTQSRSVLAGLLWPEMPEADARMNLRQALTTLRRTIGDYLIATRHDVTFNQERPYQLDTQIFDRVMAEEAQDVDLLHQAIELYQGDFLDGFSLRQTLEFEDWMLMERAKFRQMALQALQRLIDHHNQAGDYPLAIDYANQLLMLEPWHEATHRQLMSLLARNGQPSAALAQYETCCKILADELGVEPLPETTELYNQLKERRETSPHNLPAQITRFVGRHSELAHITHCLDQSECRLLTLTGSGGIGKTRLAIQAAGQQLNVFQDGVFFVPLVGVTTAELLVATIADKLGLVLSGPTEPREQLLTYLANREMLIVLDNFEHLLAETLILTNMLNRTTQLKLLITSRERLNLQEEWLLDLNGLPYPDEEQLPVTGGTEDNESWEAYSAVTLFVQHVQRIHPTFIPSSTNMPYIVRLCHLLDGVPLGLTLAASWMPMLSCAEIVAEIERDLDFLTTTSRNIPDRHRSMRAVFESSWLMLSETDKDVLKKLSVFRGEFDREAAVQVTGASLQLLMTLLNKSLLQRNEAGQLNLHELLRQFAAEKLIQDSDDFETLVTQLTAQNNHSHYYLTYLQGCETRLKGQEQYQAVQDIKPALENILVAWRWAIAQGHFVELRQASPSLFLFYEMQGRLTEAEELLQESLQTLQGYSEPFDQQQHLEMQQLMAQLLAYQGRLGYFRGGYPEAREALDQSLNLAQTEQFLEQRALALHSLGLVVVMQGEYDLAKSVSQQSLNLCEQMNDVWGQAWALYTLGVATYYLGEYEAADTWTKQSLSLHGQLGNQRGEANCLNTLGLITCALYEYTLDQHPEAIRYFERNFAIRQAIGDRWGEVIALHNLGYVNCKLQNFSQARKRFQESLSLSNKIGALHLFAGTSMWLGVALMEEEAYTQAKQHFIEALQIAYQNGGLVRVMDILFRLGDLFRRQQEDARAVEYLSFVQHHPATDNRVRDGANIYLLELSTQLSSEQMDLIVARSKARALDDIVLEALNEGQVDNRAQVLMP